MSRLLKNNKGFTLVEIIITIAILSIIIIPIYSLFLTSAKANNMSVHKLNATMIAQSYMEELKAKETIRLDGFNYTYDQFIDIKQGKAFYIESINDNGNQRLYDVELQISETDYKFEEQEDISQSDLLVELYDNNIIIQDDNRRVSKSIIEDANLTIDYDENVLSYNLDEIISNSLPEDGEILIKVFLNENSKDIQMVCNNEYSDRDMIINVYKMQNSGSYSDSGKNYTIGEKQLSEIENSNSNRLYEIIIKVKEKNDTETLVELKGYKSFIN